MKTQKITSTTVPLSEDSTILEKGVVLQDRYQIIGLRALGGMGAIYEARDLRFARTLRRCAVKEIINITPDVKTRQLNLQNFEREANILATLNHPAIPHIFDYFSRSSRAYLVMEFVEGQDLEALLDLAESPIPEQRVLGWALQLCDVLKYLHGHTEGPIVFRDLKPSNIMLCNNERIVLVDFGIAKIFADKKKGTMVGTEGYSPPEQYRGLAGPKGDIYALGATMHHLLTGQDPRLQPPFSFHDFSLQKLNPAVSAATESIVMRCLEYEADQRYDSISQLEQEIQSLVRPSMAIAEGTAIPNATPPAQVDRLLWDFACEDEIRSSPTVQEDVLYIGVYDNNLYALDAASGSFMWKYPTEGGICTKACVDQDKVLFGSEDKIFYAIDNRTGRIVWSFATKDKIRSSATVAYGHVFFGSDDRNLYALHINSGSLLWTYQTGGPVRCRPLLIDEVIVFGSEDGQLYGVDMGSGELKWKQRATRGIVSSPCSDDGLIFVGSRDWNLYAFSARSGWPVWRFRTNNAIISSPTIDDNRVIVGSVDKHVYAVEARSGRSLWNAPTEGQVVSSPVAYDGKIYVGSIDGSIYCLDSKTGEQLWRFETDGPIPSSPIIHQDVLYIGSMDKHVYALRP